MQAFKHVNSSRNNKSRKSKKGNLDVTTNTTEVRMSKLLYNLYQKGNSNA